MCNRFGQGRHVGEIRVPTQCADAKQNAGAVMNLKKERSKTLRKRENNIANHLYEVVEGFLAKQESIRIAGERFKDLK